MVIESRVNSMQQTNSIKIEYIPAFQMLTGDADIKDRQTYLTHYLKELNKVKAFLVPHHGSVKNWKEWFAEVHGNCEFWPCSYGVPTNSHGHPTADFSAITRGGNSVVEVSQEYSARISGVINVGSIFE